MEKQGIEYIVISVLN